MVKADTEDAEAEAHGNGECFCVYSLCQPGARSTAAETAKCEIGFKPNKWSRALIISRWLECCVEANNSDLLHSYLS